MTHPTRRRRSYAGRLLAAGLAAVVLIGVALDSVPSSSAAPVASPAATSAQPQVDPQLTAIQQVIQRTSDQQPQNLLAHDVTSIRRTHLAWGPITINGPTATATTYETWVTTFSSSTTVQSTETNVYTLVQQAGGWTIQGDRHLSPPQPVATPGSSFDVMLPAQVRSVFVRYPQNTVPGQPLRVLVALHGIGGDGAAFAGDLTAAADQNGWVLVAPTIAYGDWMDPVQVAHEDAALINWLSGYLSQLPNQTDRLVDSDILLLGFSRGAQLAHRFAETFPQRTEAVAVVSAGSYTLPQATAADGTPLLFPFGVGDFPTTVGQPFEPWALRSVDFWVAVGTNDTNPAEVPRQFDPFQGDDRLDRAQAFVTALGALDISAQLAVFPGVPHALTPAMEGAAIAFLADHSDPTA